MDELRALKEAEEQASAHMVTFAKSFRSTPNSEESAAVETAMELAGCNAAIGRTDRRWMEAQVILRDCITRTDRVELRKIEAALRVIAD